MKTLYKFHPQPDMTVTELALIFLGIGVDITLDDKEIFQKYPNLKRHWTASKVTLDGKPGDVMN